MKTVAGTRKSATKKTKVATYEALMNLPGGVNKGDILTVENGVTKNAKNEVVSYNPSQEPNFFAHIVPLVPNFAVGEQFMLKTVENLAVVNSYRRASKQILPFMPYTVSQIKEEIVNRKKTLVYYFDIKGDTYKIEEGKTHKFSFYFFLSSSGKVQRAVIGQDEFADKFRRQSKNMFSENTQAATALDAIMKS